jgi:hypothetical protein
MTLRRKLLTGAIVTMTLLVLLPAFLLSTPVMNSYQRRIDADPNADSSKWLQMSSADWCSRTWRPEMAATRYRLFYERYKDDIRRSYALLRYAQSLEDAGRTADAREVYRKYLLEYPDLEGRQDAQIGINRIENCRP